MVEFTSQNWIVFYVNHESNIIEQYHVPSKYSISADEAKDVALYEITNNNVITILGATPLY